MSTFEVAEKKARAFLRGVEDKPKSVNAWLYEAFVSSRRRLSEELGPPDLPSFLNSVRGDLAEIALIFVNFGMVSPRMAMRIEGETIRA